MTRARLPRPHEVQAASRDPRFLRARKVTPAPSWRNHSRCRDVDPETFFPLPTEPADMAIALCSACPVQAECLRTALEAGDCEGVWGATTPRERRAMLQAWRNHNELVREPDLFDLLRLPVRAGDERPVPERLAGTPLRSSRRGSTRSPVHTPVRVSRPEEEYVKTS